jgi:hypothetical protein
MSNPIDVLREERDRERAAREAAEERASVAERERDEGVSYWRGKAAYFERREKLVREAAEAEVVALRAELAEAKTNQFPEIDESLLPDSVSGASWDPATLTALAEAHCRHAWDHNMEVKAWVVLTLLGERAAREAAEREREEMLLNEAEARRAATLDRERAEAAEADAKQLREALEHIPRCGNCMSGRTWACETYQGALGSAAAADKLDSCPHCGLKGKPFCWCGEHAPVREAAARAELAEANARADKWLARYEAERDDRARERAAREAAERERRDLEQRMDDEIVAHGKTEERAEAAERERDELLDERWRYVQAVEAAEADNQRLRDALVRKESDDREFCKGGTETCERCVGSCGIEESWDDIKPTAIVQAVGGVIEDAYSRVNRPGPGSFSVDGAKYVLAVEARAEAAERERDALRGELEQAYDCCARPSGTCFDPSVLTKVGSADPSAADVDGADKPDVASGGHHESVGERQGRQPALPTQLLVDAAGFVWRDFGEGYLSGCPFNPDNEPLPEPITAYVRAEAAEAREQQLRVDRHEAWEALEDILMCEGDSFTEVAERARRGLARKWAALASGQPADSQEGA